jgi:membrane protease YdiL (CAAX protease family)
MPPPPDPIADAPFRPGPPDLPPATTAPPHPFDRLTAREIVVACLVGMLPGVALTAVGGSRAAAAPGPLVAYVGVAIAVAAWGRVRGVRLGAVLGRAPGGRELLLAVGLGITLLLFSFGSLVTVLGLLSLAIPGILEQTSANSPQLLVFDEGRVDLVSTFLLGSAVALAAPIVEELVFRGFLFTRWGRRFGVVRGLVFSALLFGLLHFALQPLGALGLGFVAGLLYLRTRSLLVPFVTHATVNGTIFAATVLAHDSPVVSEEMPSADELRGLVALGLVLVLVTTPILVAVLRRWWPAPGAVLPYDAATGGGAEA